MTFQTLRFKIRKNFSVAPYMVKGKQDKDKPKENNFFNIPYKVKRLIYKSSPKCVIGFSLFHQPIYMETSTFKALGNLNVERYHHH
jgi:hypothetical protein